MKLGVLLRKRSVALKPARAATLRLPKKTKVKADVPSAASVAKADAARRRVAVAMARHVRLALRRVAPAELCVSVLMAIVPVPAAVSVIVVPVPAVPVVIAAPVPAATAVPVPAALDLATVGRAPAAVLAVQAVRARSRRSIPTN